MKKIILVAAGIIVSMAGFAQGFHLGVQGGANFSKIQGQSYSNGYNLGYQLGGFAEIDFSKGFGIQPEVLFNQTNTKVTNNQSDVINGLTSGEKINLNYLSIPVLLRINAGKLITFNVGPQYSILLNTHKPTLQNASDAFKNGDFALVAGAQVNLGSLKVYGRYNIGLSNVSDIQNSDNWKSQQIQLGIGLRIL